jgi:hypothetical protein
MGRACNKYGRDHKHMQNFCEKTRRKTQLGRPKSRWMNNIVTYRGVTMDEVCIGYWIY